jgi:hypothetical protein
MCDEDTCEQEPIPNRVWVALEVMKAGLTDQVGYLAKDVIYKYLKEDSNV